MKSYLRTIKKILDQEPDPAYARRAKYIFDSVGDLNRKNFLEVGCGRGFYVGVLAKTFTNASIVGIDLNEEYINTAKKRLTGLKNIKLLSGDGAKQKLEEKYDVILATEVLEHIPDDKKMLLRLKSLLKPKGKIVITVPSGRYPFLWDPLNWTFEHLFGWHIPANIWWLAGIWADHKRLYSETDLEKLFAKTGLKVVDHQRLTSYCFPFCHFLMYGIGKNIVELGLAKNFNRFEDKVIDESLIKRAILFPIKFIDKINENKKGKRSVNLGYVLQI